MHVAHILHRITPFIIQATKDIGNSAGMKLVCYIPWQSNQFCIHWTEFLNNNIIFFIGVYDLAAQIDYVLEKTKQKKLSLVGHSQGTTAGLVLLAERPEYNDKVFIFHGMTPPAIMRYFNKLFSPLVNNKEFVMVRFNSAYIERFPLTRPLIWNCNALLQHFLENFGIYDLAPHNFLAPIMKILGSFCEEPENVPLCNNAVSIVMGRSAPQNWYPVRNKRCFVAIKRKETLICFRFCRSLFQILQSFIQQVVDIYNCCTLAN